MKKIIGFLEVSPGNKSVMRLAFIMLISYSIIASSLFFFKGNWEAGIAVFSTIATVAGTFKVIQTSQEVKEDKDGAKD